MTTGSDQGADEGYSKGDVILTRCPVCSANSAEVVRVESAVEAELICPNGHTFTEAVRSDCGGRAAEVTTFDSVRLPEGLTLTTFDEGVAGIVDAQDLPWVEFSYGHSDPPDWLATVIRKTCIALGVTQGVFDTKFVTVEQFITELVRVHTGEDGFLL